MIGLVMIAFMTMNTFVLCSSIEDAGIIDGMEPIRIPPGEYYISLGYRWCINTITTFPKPAAKVINRPPWILPSPDENPKAKRIYSQWFTEPKEFTLSYDNEQANAFQLHCDTCQNRFHGSAVTLVNGLLEFGTEPVEFRAYKFKNDNPDKFRLALRDPGPDDSNRWVRRTRGKKGQLKITSKPHAFRIRFIKATDYSEDQITYYDLRKLERFRSVYRHKI